MSRTPAGLELGANLRPAVCDTNAVDEYSWTQQTPIGRMTVRAGKKGVRSIAFGASAAKRTAPVPPAGRRIAKAIDRYFDGDALALERVPVDLDGVPNDFQRKVLATLRGLVGPGQTISYGELAAAVGHPGAARAVGTALARTPVPIVVPCHRVLAADGSIGGYGAAGTGVKRRLLAIEGTVVGKGRRSRATPR